MRACMTAVAPVTSARWSRAGMHVCSAVRRHGCGCGAPRLWRPCRACAVRKCVIALGCAAAVGDHRRGTVLRQRSTCRREGRDRQANKARIKGGSFWVGQLTRGLRGGSRRVQEEADADSLCATTWCTPGRAGSSTRPWWGKATMIERQGGGAVAAWPPVVLAAGEDGSERRC